MSNWRDHTNNMTVAERVEAWLTEFHPGMTFENCDSELVSLCHVCANAELERRRAVQADRDRLRAQLAEQVADNKYLVSRCEEQRQQLLKIGPAE